MVQVASTGRARRRPRAEWAAIVANASAHGETGTAIAAHFGLSSTYVYELLNDPTGEKARRRKDGYRQPCPECGTLMDGANGRNGPALCAACAGARLRAERKWTRETVIAAMQRWSRMMGRAPSSKDWRRAHTWCDADGSFASPAAVTVYGGRWRKGESPFDYWSDALEAAGLAPSRSCAKTGATDRIRALVADGADHTSGELAGPASPTLVTRLVRQGELERVSYGVYRAGPNLKRTNGGAIPAASSTAARRAA